VSTKTRTARVRTVEPLEGFVLRIGFDDRTVREIDLEPELWGPVFEPLRHDPELFRQVRVDEELGTIVWPNGADLDPDVLHGEAPPAPRS
jgi:Protein of unknown function (DUF2442)